MEVNISTELQQGLRLSPQQLQSMRILQMDAQELLEYINELAEENPALEVEEVQDLRDELRELGGKVSWLDRPALSGPAARANDEDDEPQFAPASWDTHTESLSAFLCDQLDRQKLPVPFPELCKALAEMLSDSGYLEPEDIDYLLGLGVPRGLLDRAIAILQGLEPAGVAARNAQECLLLQLARMPGDPSLARAIISGHLELLSREQYGLIAKKLAVPVEQVHEAAQLIRQLTPCPGAAFEAAQQPEYVRPDIYILELEGSFQPVLNTSYLPRISVSDYYTRMMHEMDSQEVRSYLRKKIQQAKWVVDCLDRRRSTLEGCAGQILELQRDFFLGKTDKLEPMTLKTVAQSLGLHESTISRCVRGKYLQCRQGVFPMQFFFSHAVGGPQGISEQAIKIELARLIREEDPARPYSDQRLCELLFRQSIPIARRTVAKYRDQMRIPSASKRKR